MNSELGRRRFMQMSPALAVAVLGGHAWARPGFPSAKLADVMPDMVPAHPRLLMSEAKLAECRAKAKADPLYARLIARIIREADYILKEGVVHYSLTGAERPSMLGGSRQIIRRIAQTAFAWRWTGDRRYADRARLEMLNAARFPEWNHTHFLDVAETAFGVALGYDWLYSELTEDDRAVIRMALVEKSLLWADRAYRTKDDGWLGFPDYWWNWNPVCNGGVLAAAIAVAEQEPQLSRDVIAGIRASLPKSMEALGPDGGGPEGPVYWAYGIMYQVLCLEMLKSALGSEMGIGDGAPFARTDLYRLWVEGPTGKGFNYGDCKEHLYANSTLGWLGVRNRHPQVIDLARREMLASLDDAPRNGEFDRFFFLYSLWFPEKQDRLPAMPAAAHFGGDADIACFRADWTNPNAAYLGFKAGNNGANHSHMDLGSFVLDGQGVRWSSDLGSDSYQVPGYFDSQTPQGGRYRIFRIGTASHSAFMPEGMQQAAKAVAPITAFAVKPDGGHAIADLGAAYPGHAEGVRRGIRFLRGGRVVQIRDEVTGARPDQRWRWAMVTQADVALQGNRAVLTLDGRRMVVVAHQPGARFELLPLTPPTSVENPNEGYRLLALFHRPGADGRIISDVTLYPLGGESGAPAPSPLDLW